MNPIAPSRIAARTSTCIAPISSCGGGALGRVVAHDVAPHRAVSDVRAHVHAEPTIEPVEEVGEASHRGSAPLGERVRRHALHPAQHLEQPRRRRRGFGGREGESAVPGEQRGDAVPRRRRRGRIPVELRVVVGVDVDEAGRHEQAVGVDDPRGGFVELDRRRRCARRGSRRRRCAPERRCRRRPSRPRIRRSNVRCHTCRTR